MPMICQHIFMEIVTVKGWYGFSKECTEKLDEIVEVFRGRFVTPYIRAMN